MLPGSYSNRRSISCKWVCHRVRSRGTKNCLTYLVATRESAPKILSSFIETPVNLNEQRLKTLNTLLTYSPLFRSVWEWKEAFTTWYECSPSYSIAKSGFKRWCEQGDRIDHPAVQSTLKPCKTGKKKSSIIIIYERLNIT